VASMVLDRKKANDVQDCIAAEEEEELLGFVEDINFQSFYDDTRMHGFLAHSCSIDRQ